VSFRLSSRGVKLDAGPKHYDFHSMEDGVLTELSIITLVVWGRPILKL